MARPLSPDDVLWRYLELRERLGSAPAHRLVAETGLLFDHRCPRCGAGSAARILVEKRLAHQVRGAAYRCTACQGSWPVHVGFLLRNEVGGWRSLRRRGGLEAGLTELAGYGLALSRLSMRERRIYLELYVFGQRGCYAAVAYEANRRWPRMKPLRDGRTAGPRWTEWHVRVVCESARRKISASLGDIVPTARAS